MCEDKSFHSELVTKYAIACVMVFVIPLKIVFFQVHAMDPVFVPLLEASLELTFWNRVESIIVREFQVHSGNYAIIDGDSKPRFYLLYDTQEEFLFISSSSFCHRHTLLLLLVSKQQTQKFCTYLLHVHALLRILWHILY
jgi:hypothetical protein